MQRSLSPSTWLGLFLLSAATLVFEINLTRLFSVAQFYHFAFMIVSIALLGFGASGTFLALLPAHRRPPLPVFLALLSLAASASLLGAYLLTNWLPFDSFSIAWDRRQVFILALHYTALSAPFFCSGMAVGLLLEADPLSAGSTYAANLFGSALGCLLALLLPILVGGEGSVSAAAALAVLPAGLFLRGSASAAVQEPVLTGSKALSEGGTPIAARLTRLLLWLVLIVVLCTAGLDFFSRLSGKAGLTWLDLRISPYKGLSYALQVPGAQRLSSRWNAFARVDLVRSDSIHSFPGLSYRNPYPLPPLDGIFVDGDDLSPLVRLVDKPQATDLRFTEYLPSALAYQMRPQARALILEPRAGLDVLTALHHGASAVTAVEINPQIVRAAGPVYSHPRLTTVYESERSYLRRNQRRGSDAYDVIVVSLVSGFHPVRSGAYSLAEDYRYTVQAFQDALLNLRADGLLVATRWLQLPPSESLRLFATCVEALEGLGLDPAERLVALRGYNTATVLASTAPFTPAELQLVEQFAAQRAYDMVYAPMLDPQLINRYNILPEPIYHQEFTALLAAPDRKAYYASYPYEVSPPTDAHPFFGHFFKWSQTKEVLAELGHTWQPFGGAGYFVVLALLGLALLLAGLLILLPVWLSLRSQSGGSFSWRRMIPFLFYFAAIGFAFLMVEIPLIQRFILYLGQPAYAFTLVLFALLFFSGLGSQISARLKPAPKLLILSMLVLASLFYLPWLFNLTLGMPLVARLGLGVLALAPPGFLMGLPFPAGIRWLAQRYPQQPRVAWIWAVNGAASVVSAILAALLALWLGFTWVLVAGAACYALAWLTFTVGQIRRGAAPPHQ